MCNSKATELAQISMLASSDFLFTEDSLKIKKGLELVLFSIELYDKKSYLVMLHKLAKFHYQTVFASQVIQ